MLFLSFPITQYYLKLRKNKLTEKLYCSVFLPKIDEHLMSLEQSCQ